MFDPLFWLVVALVALQYSRMAVIKEKMFGLKQKSVLKDTLVASGFGLAGGFVGSLVLIFIGVTLSGAGLAYLWPLAILLMLINARFLCFAYAGGILSLSHLLFGFPQVNVPQVLALVAILHMVESALIWASGHLGAVPSFFKDSAGRVLGGFTLQKFWPIPIVALIVVGHAAMPQGINMPEWWPLIKPPENSGNMENLIYALFPVVAGLGYGDLAIARNPVKKSRRSAINLFLYSITLLVLSVLAQHSLLTALVAALFSPLGHELVIHIGKQMEFRGRPLYVPSTKGIRVLDALPGTAAWQAGIRSGDILVAINGTPTRSKTDLYFALRACAQINFAQTDYARSDFTQTDFTQENFVQGDFAQGEGSRSIEVEYLEGESLGYRRETVPAPENGHPFGLLPVPEGNEENYMELSTAGPLGRWWGQFWEKIRR